MIIKKCDRCGQIIEEKKENVFENLTKNIKEAFGYSEIQYFVARKEQNLLYMDFCPECYQGLVNWIKRGDAE